MSLRKLAGDTMIYGLSSVLARFIHFALTPLHTEVFSTAEFGILTNVYAITALLFIFFTYRMEVAYFRFGTDKTLSEQKVFDTGMLSLIVSTFFLAALFLPFAPSIAGISIGEGYSTYFVLALAILCVDTLNEIPFSRLRLQGRPLRFAFIRITSIVVMVLLNLFFLLFCPYILEQGAETFGYDFVNRIYKPEFGVGYVLVANLIGNAVATVLHLPTIFAIRFSGFDKGLWKAMFSYAWPLVIVGLAYVVNEVFDRMIMPHWMKGTSEEVNSALGIYAASYKFTMAIALFTQAFRLGAEPFFFKQKTADNAKQLYADVAKFFAMITLIGFLSVNLYIDPIKAILLRQPEYEAGLHIVPILLLANLCLGLYYTLSVWFKVTDRTQWGAYISVGGAIITVTLNYFFMPAYGYTAAAWATLACYSSMLVANFLIGQHFYRIPYQVGRVLGYLVLALLSFLAGEWVRTTFADTLFLVLVLNTLILLLFMAFLYWQERESVRGYL